MDLLVVAIFLALVYFLSLIFGENRKNRPPGPFRLPLIGSLLSTATDEAKYPYETFENLAKQYGPIYYLRNGAVSMVVVNGYDACKKILTNDEWLERTDSQMMLMRLYNKRQGIMYGHLNFWRASRRFTTRNLRDYGFGKKDSMEVFIRREAEEIETRLDKLLQDQDGRLQPLHFFDIPSLNIVWALLTGVRFSHDDSQVSKLVDGITKINQALRFGEGILQAYPALQNFLPGSWLGLPELQRIMHNFQMHMEDLIEDFRSKGNYRTMPENFVERFLQHIDLARSGQMSDPQRIFTDENLVCILYDLFWAGSDTTSATMAFGILWLTIHQNIQRRLRTELAHFVTTNKRQPEISDKPALPYTRATILEIARISSILPLSPRKVYRDTPLNDFVVPAGTTVMINYHSVLMEEKFWGDPENFRPERFLDEDNNVVNADHVIPFGLGKRNCMGETVAETSVFLFLTFLFSTYEFLPLSEGSTYDPSPTPGIVLAPKPFIVRVQRLGTVI